MLSSPVVDVAVGMSFLFALFSVLVSKVNETITSWLGARHQGLEKALRAMLGGLDDRDRKQRGITGQDAELAADREQFGAVNVSALLLHPLVRTQSKAVANTPGRIQRSRRKGGLSYLSAATFSAAMLDLLDVGAPPGNAKETLAGIKDSDVPTADLALLHAAQVNPSGDTLAPLIAALTGPAKTTAQQAQTFLDQDPIARAKGRVAELADGNPAKKPLLGLLEDAGSDRDRLRASLESWYDDTMDRVSGWYKRYVQRIVLVLSLVLVLGANLDALNIVQDLWQVPAERAAVAAAAANDATKAQAYDVDADVRTITALRIPLGWSMHEAGRTTTTTSGGQTVTRVSNDPRDYPRDLPGWLLKVLGLALSVLALSFGAPFWFDTLSNIARLRQTGPKPATASATASGT